MKLRLHWISTLFFCLVGVTLHALPNEKPSWLIAPGDHVCGMPVSSTVQDFKTFLGEKNC